MKKRVVTSALLLMVPLFASVCSGAIDNPQLIKLPLGLGPQRIENTPVIYQGRPLLIENSRLSNEGISHTAIDMYIVDLTTSEIISRFGSTFAFHSAFVRGDELNVFATENTKSDWTGSIYRFWSTDLKTWKKERIIAKEKDRHFFNTSVCETPDGYLMAYESNKPVQWCFQLARSNDLSHWEPIAELIFADIAEGSCLANPTLRYIEPYYYIVYGIHRGKGRAAGEYQYHRPDSKYFTFIMRSKDLITWDLSPTTYPMLEPEVEDGNNATDADLFEFMGHTYLFYGAGWQDTRGTIRVKMYPGTMKECLESYFDDSVAMIKFDARNGRYLYPDQQSSRPEELARPTPEQIQWQDAEMGMFIHFGLWSMLPGVTSDLDVLRDVQRSFNPVDLDTDQWVRVAESMGAKYVVYTAKHGDGFCMWQTDTTDFNIQNTPWRQGQGDIMADLARSCEKHGMKLGIYLNAQNMYTSVDVGGKCDTPEAQEAYNKIYRQQLTELLTHYGPIFEVWFDGSLVVPVKDILETYAPRAMVFQSPQATIRWVGNENGFASYPAWNAVDWNDPTVNQGFGTDRHGDPDGNRWLPLECDARIRNMWMYQAENNPLKSVDYLMDMYYHSVGYGAVLLLNNTPDPTGLIPETDAKRSAEFGAEIKRRFGKSLAKTSGKGDIVTLPLDEPVVIDHVITMEDITGGERVRQYVIEGRIDNQWQQIAEGLSIGHKKIDRFAPVRVDGIRIRVTQRAAEPLIRQLAVYRAGVELTDTYY